jgi:ABC-type long-subunit fatty acid transport system fused permease/ATPase subunit
MKPKPGPESADGLDELRELVENSVRNQQNPYADYFEKKLTEPQPITKKQQVYSCVSAFRLIQYIAWVLMLSAGVIVLGYAVRWVFRGFNEVGK